MEETSHLKNGPSEDLEWRIKGLENAKSFEGMTRADIEALDRTITKLKAKLAEKFGAKKEDEGM